MRRAVHVVPHPAGWAVRREGATLCSSVHPTRGDALRVDRLAAQREQTTVVVHDHYGRIKERDTWTAVRFPAPNRKS